VADTFVARETGWRKHCDAISFIGLFKSQLHWDLWAKCLFVQCSFNFLSTEKDLKETEAFFKVGVGLARRDLLHP